MSCCPTDHSTELERHEPIDSAPLTWDQLSPHEQGIVREIDSRIRNAEIEDDPRCVDRGKSAYLAEVATRHSRVLLIDGARGTGKTSLLLTVVHRWNCANPSGTKSDASSPDIPDNVYVPGRILDFDPLPPSIPLVAWIVQAWWQIANKFSASPAAAYGCHEESQNQSLLDLWHQLFQVAAGGWTDITRNQGLIDQILDRQEQVRDWHSLDRLWRKFVDELVKLIQGSKGRGHKPVFVIVIDDVDLQVRRIRELLPALRLLYHPRVFFLVAAHKEHMLDMLKADFYGQQKMLAQHNNARLTTLREVIDEDRWSSVLATSAVEKVFSRRNQWKLSLLSLSDFLRFYLQTPKAGFEAASTALLANYPGVQKFAQATELAGLPGVMTYRTASQLCHYAAQKSQPAATVLAKLLSSNEDEHEAIVESDGSVYLPIAGELAALHRPGPSEQAGEHAFVLSARPDFVFLPRGGQVAERMGNSEGHGFNFTGALLAKQLEKERARVEVSGLAWNTYLGHAWTEWSSPPKLSFDWKRHTHPSPVEVFTQAEEWSAFVALFSSSRLNASIEMWAYAWVYYQRKWNNLPLADGLTPPRDFDENSRLQWEKLLQHGNPEEESERRWRLQTLPLLARPELMFPPDVQRHLLKAFEESGPSRPYEYLRRQRGRFLTDAGVAAVVQSGAVPEELITEIEAEELMKQIDKSYKEAYGEPSPWTLAMERGERATGSRRSSGL